MWLSTHMNGLIERPSGEVDLRQARPAHKIRRDVIGAAQYCIGLA